MSDDQSSIIPEDLKAKISALKALNILAQLIGRDGKFSYELSEVIKVSLAFINSVHLDLFHETLKHPQKDLIEDLRNYKPGDSHEQKSSETSSSVSSK